MMEMEHTLDDANDNSQKKGRHRKKQLYKSILQQMEFYFSDSNLTKERYLGQLIQSDPYVDVSIFLQFNRIRKLTSSLDDVIKAISKSELIELSEDKTKVRRKVPVKIKENVDECTIYVERLKSEATHEWLSSIFSDFGKVVYVSIPKYNQSNIIKGFAFIEFETEEGANNALNFFESIDCKIPTAMDPHKLCSISTFDGKNGKQHNSASEEAQEETEVKIGKKRKLSTDLSEEQRKKVKSDSDTDISVHAEIETCPKEKNNKKRKKGDIGDGDQIKDESIPLDSSVGISEQDAISEGEEKKRKKQKKAHRKKMNLKELGLHVLSKKDWKKMRNRYLVMQKKTMAELKRHLNQQRSSDFCASKNKVKVQQKEVKIDEETKSNAHEFTPGIIVKMCLPEPVVESKKKLKDELKTTYTDIQYIDIPHAYGSQEIYIRFKDSEGAQTFCASDLKGNEACVLEGDEEQKYWQKIEESRNAKLKNANRKQRGRDKLLKKAEKRTAKHIRFDNSD